MSIYPFPVIDADVLALARHIGAEGRKRGLWAVDLPEGVAVVFPDGADLMHLDAHDPAEKNTLVKAGGQETSAVQWWARFEKLSEGRKRVLRALGHLLAVKGYRTGKPRVGTWSYEMEGRSSSSLSIGHSVTVRIETQGCVAAMEQAISGSFWLSADQAQMRSFLECEEEPVILPIVDEIGEHASDENQEIEFEKSEPIVTWAKDLPAEALQSLDVLAQAVIERSHWPDYMSEWGLEETGIALLRENLVGVSDAWLSKARPETLWSQDERRWRDECDRVSQVGEADDIGFLAYEGVVEKSFLWFSRFVHPEAKKWFLEDGHTDFNHASNPWFMLREMTRFRSDVFAAEAARRKGLPVNLHAVQEAIDFASKIPDALLMSWCDPMFLEKFRLECRMLAAIQKSKTWMASSALLLARRMGWKEVLDMLMSNPSIEKTCFGSSVQCNVLNMWLAKTVLLMASLDYPRDRRVAICAAHYLCWACPEIVIQEVSPALLISFPCAGHWPGEETHLYLTGSRKMGLALIPAVAWKRCRLACGQWTQGK